MTSLVRFSPSTELRRMQREIDRIFDEFVPSRSSENSENDTTVWTPRADVSETDDAYVLHLDAPGLKKEDFSINWKEGVLTVNGEREWENQTERKNYVRVERAFGHFFRSFQLPTSVDGENITANYQDGVLTIQIPKAEESKPRRIEIK